MAAAGKSAPVKRPAAAELQGLYGPVTVSETLLQKIWQRQDFSREELTTQNGESLRVLSPGRWNRLEGPDFLGAEMEIAGRRLRGDVEIHFRQRDWRDHGHHRNPLYGNVILHTLLFEPAVKTSAARRADGHAPATFVLLPWLRQDLEEYLMEETLFALGRQQEAECLRPLCGKPLEECRQIFRRNAQCRWEQKRRHAKTRLEKFGWEEACHQCFLEVLGSRRNRAPMSRLAAGFPLRRMRGGARDARYYFEQEQGRWRLRGVRPASHPLRRLGQYLELLEHRPAWPQALADWQKILPHGQPEKENTAAFRRRAALKSCRNQLANEVLAGCFPGARLDTLAADALLPLLAAGHDTDLFACWFHWYGGDFPAALGRFLAGAGIRKPPRHPACNGSNQGALHFFFQQGLT